MSSILFIKGRSSAQTCIEILLNTLCWMTQSDWIKLDKEYNLRTSWTFLWIFVFMSYDIYTAVDSIGHAKSTQNHPESVAIALNQGGRVKNDVIIGVGNPDNWWCQDYPPQDYPLVGNPEVGNSDYNLLDVSPQISLCSAKILMEASTLFSPEKLHRLLLRVH